MKPFNTMDGLCGDSGSAAILLEYLCLTTVFIAFSLRKYFLLRTNLRVVFQTVLLELSRLLSNLYLIVH